MTYLTSDEWIERWWNYLVHGTERSVIGPEFVEAFSPKFLSADPPARSKQRNTCKCQGGRKDAPEEALTRM